MDFAVNHLFFRKQVLDIVEIITFQFYSFIAFHMEVVGIATFSSTVTGTLAMTIKNHFFIAIDVLSEIPCFVENGKKCDETQRRDKVNEPDWPILYFTIKLNLHKNSNEENYPQGN